MATPAFKIVFGSGDWGSPMANDATFDTLEEAQGAAREFLVRQREAGGPAPRAIIEETAADGSVMRHSAD